MTSRPNVTVSWEVKATRNDRFVRAYGAPTEQLKPADLRGTYLQPELYGMPSDRAQFQAPAQPQAAQVQLQTIASEQRIGK